MAGGPGFLDLWVSPKLAPVLQPSDFPISISWQLSTWGTVINETILVVS